jgi:hypothetical protein
MNEPTIYRANPLLGCGSLVLCIGITASALLIAIGPETRLDNEEQPSGPTEWAGSAFMLVGAALLLIASVHFLTLRVVVAEWGIACSSWLWSDFSARWDAIESWSVERTEEGNKVVRFCIRGRRRPASIYEDYVWRRKFDDFVKDLHTRRQS